MSPSPTLIFKVIFFLESLVAMLQNGFIVTMMSGEWACSRTLPASDMIVACLAASRFCLHGMALLNNLMASSGFCSKIYYFGIPWDFITSLSFWLTAWLAVFYCTKISLFSHLVFWIKWRISRSVLQLLLGSLILSGLTVVSSAAGHTILAQMTAAQSSHGNTLAGSIHAVYLHCFLPHVILMRLVPFLLFLVSTFSLMVSLRRHLGQIQDRRPSPRDPSTWAHTMALKSLAFFLIFYTLHFLSLVIIVYIPAFWKHWHWACEVVTYAGICLPSSILMHSSPKLRKALKKKLWQALDKDQFVSTYQYQ